MFIKNSLNVRKIDIKYSLKDIRKIDIKYSLKDIR